MRKIFVISLFALVCFCWGIVSISYANNVCFDCHDRAEFTGKVVHKPVNRDQCSTCHNPHVARYKGLLNSKEDMLCYSCHQDQEKVFNQGVVHVPVAQGKCSVCHTPHVSNSKGLLRGKLAEACFNCHETLQREYPQTHKPFAQGQCTVCHKPHQADNLDLLADKADSLCFSCHDLADLQKGHQNYPKTLGGCLSCHNPHGSDRVALVRNNLHEPYKEGCGECHGTPAGITTAACLNCHDDVQKQMLSIRSHLTRHDGNACLSCHSPHAGDTPFLLKSGERQVCLSCHEETIAKFKHPDINKCTSCHQPHGSIYLPMLKGNGNDVCTECHKTQGQFTHPVGPEVLDPISGQMVTCVSCHNPMGTEYEYHMLLDGERALCNQCHLSY